MTPEHEKHLQSIKDRVCSLIDKKYRSGYIEHGKGKLWEHNKSWFEDEIQNEIIDLVVYWLSKPKGLKIEGDVK